MGNFWIRYSKNLRCTLNLTYPGPKYYLEEMDSLWLHGICLHNKCNRIHTYIRPMQSSKSSVDTDYTRTLLGSESSD